jgi:hypothetical protein
MNYRDLKHICILWIVFAFGVLLGMSALNWIDYLK